MEVSQLIELMNAVSEAGLTDFCYEENGVSVKIKKHPEKKIVASAPVEMIAPAAVAAPLQVCADTSVSADTDVSEEVTGNIVKSPLVGTDVYKRQDMDPSRFLIECESAQTKR